MFEVIGFKPINYTRKSDGKHIEGVEVYMVGDSTDDRVQGRECLSAYLNRENASYRDPVIGDIVKPSYNRWGRIDDLIPLTR